MSRLSHSERLWVVDLLTEVYEQGGRAALLGSLPLAYRSGLPVHTVPRLQCLSDVQRLDDDSPLVDGQDALVQVLQTAALLFQSRTEQQELTALIQRFEDAPPRARTSSDDFVSPRPLEGLVLFMSLGDPLTERVFSAASVTIEEESARFTINDVDDADRVFFRQQESTPQSVFVAYGNQCFRVRSLSFQQRQQSGAWESTVSVTLERESRGSTRDININGFSAERQAELRARLILLGEDPVEVLKEGRDAFNTSWLDRSIRTAGNFRIVDAPLAKLHQQYGQQPEVFLGLAKVYCVAFLLVSETVEHILTLDLSLEASGAVAVNFRGQRHRVYTNVEPHIIEVKGTWKPSTAS